MKTIKRCCKVLIYFLILAIFVVPGAALAQDTSSISQTPETVRPEQPPPERETIPGLESPEQIPEALPDEATLFVSDFKLEGVEFVNPAELQAILDPYRNRELSISQINSAAARITQFYQKQGYILTRAYIPQQDARNGVLTIAVVAGRYGDIALNNESLMDDEFIRNFLQRLEPGEVALRGDLERKLLLIGDLPGAGRPSMAVAPGKAFGTADLALSVPKGDRLNGYLTLDNQGSRYTGRYRFGAGLDINSLVGVGDRLSLNAVVTDEINKGLLNGRFAYSVPIGFDGLRVEMSAERTTYELNKEYRQLDATGQTDTLRGTLSYPIIRSQNQNLWLSLSGAHKNIKDEIEAYGDINRKRAILGTGSLQYERWFRVFGEYRLYASAGASITYGNLRILSHDHLVLDRAGANTNGSFSYVNFNFMANYVFMQNFSFNMIFNAQQVFNHKNLNGSEQFIISGPAGVRGYREAVSGDNGYFLNGELRYQLPEFIAGWRHSLGVFSGIGHSYYANGDYVTENGNTLYDVGLGYYANYEPFFAKMQLSQIVGPRPNGVYTDGRTQFLAHIGITF